MKRKEIKELPEKDLKKLSTMFEELRKENTKLIVEKNARKLKNVSLISEKKKDIARILTVIRKKELEVK